MAVDHPSKSRQPSRYCFLMVTVETAFRNARRRAAQHMGRCESASLRWGETSITEIVTSSAAAAVTVVPFTQRAEARSGADWIWWWVDKAAAYGMLVQAKRLTIAADRWRFGFDYQSQGSARLQREVLIDVASSLDLLPVYALYLGTGSYRGWEPCSDEHRKGDCAHCVRRTISLMPALLASDVIVDDSVSTYEWSVALEELWTPSRQNQLLIPSLTSQLAPELLAFLTTPQNGTLAVARSMIDRVLQARAGMFSATYLGTNVPLGQHDHLGPIFNRVPGDTIHGGVPYFERVLSPLRYAPPAYVLDILSGEAKTEELQSQLPQSVAGVVVVHTPPSRRSARS